jgi:DNA-binding transcriptional ArsR family regulator
LVIADDGPAFAMTSRAGAHARVTDALSLSALNKGDALNLTPGNLVTHLRKLEDAGYLTSETTRGRAALDVYAEALRNLVRGLAP